MATKSSQVKQVVPVINTAQLYSILDATSAASNVLLAGAHGIGKSEILTAWGENHNYNVVPLFLGQVGDPGDLIGLPRESNGRTVYSSPEWWPTDSRPALVFLDELNRAPRSITSAIFDLVLNKRLMGRPLPAGSRIVSAINAGEAYDVRDMDAALASRFMPFMFAPTPQEWIDWATRSGVDARVIEFISTHNDALDSDGSGVNPTDQLSTLARTPDRRAWARLGRDLNAGVYVDQIIALVAIANIGITRANEFITASNEYSTIDWILRNKRILGKPCANWGAWCKDAMKRGVATELLPILESHPHSEIQFGATLLKKLLADKELADRKIREIEEAKKDPVNAKSLADLPPMTLHKVTIAAPAVCPKTWNADEKLANVDWSVSVHGGPLQRPPILVGIGKGTNWGGSDHMTEQDVPVLVNTFIMRFNDGTMLAAIGHYHQYLSEQVDTMGPTDGPRINLGTDPILPKRIRGAWSNMTQMPTVVTKEFYVLLRDTIAIMGKAGRLTKQAFQNDVMEARVHEVCI
jgi:hypothetical protein